MTTAGYKHFDRGYKNIDVVNFHGDIDILHSWRGRLTSLIGSCVAIIFSFGRINPRTRDCWPRLDLVLGRILAVCQKLVLGTLRANDIVPVCDEALKAIKSTMKIKLSQNSLHSLFRPWTVYRGRTRNSRCASDGLQMIWTWSRPGRW